MIYNIVSIGIGVLVSKKNCDIINVGIELL